MLIPPSVQSHLSLLIVVLVSMASSIAEARHWRYHAYYGYYDRGQGKVQDQTPFDSKTEDKRHNFGATVSEMIRACGVESAELKKTPFDVITRTVRPNASQQDALDEIRKATFDAADTLSANCPKDVSGVPSDVLDSLGHTFEAMRDSRARLHSSVAKFYSLLDDEQKARIVLNISAASSLLKSEHASGSNSAPGDDGQGPCRQWGVTLRSWPTKQIEMEMDLSDEQHAALYDVTAAMYRAAADVITSCPTQGYLTTVGRLDTQQKQLEALRRGVNITRPALGRFENLLSAAQRTRLGEIAGTLSPLGGSANQSVRR